MSRDGSRASVVVGVLAAVVLAACSAVPGSSTPSSTPASPTPSPTPAATGTASAAPSPTASPSDTATPDPVDPTVADAVVAPVGAAQWARIVAAGMDRPGCPMTRATLRRVEVNHWTFEGTVRRGVLVVNADVAESVARIFTRLFEAEYPIRRMRPLENYGGDNEKSMADDNTAAFNCRTAAQQNAPQAKSPHANGRAIDINPMENPWKDPRCRCWSPSDEYGETRTGRGVITKASVVWKAFVAEGWIWQDISVADYMHFDTGYPSVPWTDPLAG